MDNKQDVTTWRPSSKRKHFVQGTDKDNKVNAHRDKKEKSTLGSSRCSVCSKYGCFINPHNKKTHEESAFHRNFLLKSPSAHIRHEEEIIYTDVNLNIKHLNACESLSVSSLPTELLEIILLYATNHHTFVPLQLVCSLFYHVFCSPVFQKTLAKWYFTNGAPYRNYSNSCSIVPIHNKKSFAQKHAVYHHMKKTEELPCLYGATLIDGYKDWVVAVIDDEIIQSYNTTSKTLRSKIMPDEAQEICNLSVHKEHVIYNTSRGNIYYTPLQSQLINYVGCFAFDEVLDPSLCLASPNVFYIAHNLWNESYLFRSDVEESFAKRELVLKTPQLIYQISPRFIALEHEVLQMDCRSNDMQLISKGSITQFSEHGNLLGLATRNEINVFDIRQFTSPMLTHFRGGTNLQLHGDMLFYGENYWLKGCHMSENRMSKTIYEKDRFDTLKLTSSMLITCNGRVFIRKIL